MKLTEIKVKLKKNAPMILMGVSTIVATAFALGYRNELVKLQTVDPDEWPSFEVSPRAAKNVEEGATLKLRMGKGGPNKNRKFIQFTTDDEFSPEAEEEFAEYTK